MKKSVFTNFLFENFSIDLTYLKYFKTTSLDKLSLNLPKTRKEFYIKLYNKVKEDLALCNTAFVTTFHKGSLQSKKDCYHNSFYSASLEKKHLSFLDKMHNKSLLHNNNFCSFQSVKIIGYNARYNTILALKSTKTSKIKAKSLKLLKERLL